MATRYKVTKDQLERIVENFVIEAAMESKKASVKNMIPSQSADAKKHVKNKMSGNMVDQSEGMPSVTPMKKKLSQASDAKKHMSKAGMKHTNKAKVVKEGFLLRESEQQEIVGVLPTQVISALNEKGISPEKFVGQIESALSKMSPKVIEEIKYSMAENGINNLSDVEQNTKAVAAEVKDEIKTSSMSDTDYMDVKSGYKAGLSSLAAGLGSLGVLGGMEEKVAENLFNEKVFQNLLTLSSTESWLFVLGTVLTVGGIITTTVTRTKQIKQEDLKAKLDYGRRMGYKEEVKDEKGNVVNLKNKEGELFIEQ